MIVVKELNFVYGEQFLPIFQILIFYSSSFKYLQIKSEDQLDLNWFMFNVFISFGLIDFVLVLPCVYFGHIYLMKIGTNQLKYDFFRENLL